MLGLPTSGSLRSAAMGFASAALVATTSPRPARAADQVSNTARELALEGRAAYVAGDYGRALELFQQAYALLPAPTILEYEGRSLEKIGKLVEAADAYERTTRTIVDSGSPEQFRRAVADAEGERAALEPRIPTFILDVTGSAANDPKLSIVVDGNVLLGSRAAPRQANPGAHRVTARAASGAEATAVFSLDEGETKHIDVVLRTPAVVLPSDHAAAPTAGALRDASNERDHRSPSPTRIVAYSALGLGAAGLATGVVAGSLSMARHSDAERDCPDRGCVAGTQGETDLDAFRSLRTVSTVGYVVGGVAGITGLVLLLTAVPSEGRPSVGNLRPWLGVGAAGVRGRF
jgi:hypothetical protein